MAPSVLGLGIPSTFAHIPEDVRPHVAKALQEMEALLNASPYDFEMFYVEPGMDNLESLLSQKLQQKEWDVVCIGTGVRTMLPLTAFFEQLVNAVHKELPKAKFCFNESIEDSESSIQRALGL